MPQFTVVAKKKRLGAMHIIHVMEVHESYTSRGIIRQIIYFQGDPVKKKFQLHKC